MLRTSPLRPASAAGQPLAHESGWKQWARQMLVRLTSKDPSSLRRPFVWSCLQMNIHKSSFHTWRVVWGKSRLELAAAGVKTVRRRLEPPYYYFPTFRYTAMQCLFSLVSLLRTGWYMCVCVMCASKPYSYVPASRPASHLAIHTQMWYTTIGYSIVLWVGVGNLVGFRSGSGVALSTVCSKQPAEKYLCLEIL